MRIKQSFPLLILGIGSLLAGAVLYFMFCPDVWFVQKISNFLNLSRDTYWILDSRLLLFLRFYLFDFLWAFSLNIFLFILIGNNAKSIVLSMLITTVVGIIMELFQLWNLASGTFDRWDILAELTGAIVSAIIIYFIWRRKRYEKE